MEDMTAPFEKKEGWKMERIKKIRCNIKIQWLGMVLGAALLLSGCGGGTIQESAGGESQETTEAVSAETTEAGQEAVQLMELELPDNRLDDNNRMYYEVFVYSFADSDGDGIGDLKGLTERLDYIEDLGCNGIWLMPVNASTTYHKYDVTDYYTIDPEYGTLEDFQAFLKECENRQIKVIMDLAVNHSSSEHPWFKEAAQYLKLLSADQEPNLAECPSVDYYNFTKDGADRSGYVKLEGSDYYYEAQFWEGMPDLNLGSEALRAELEKVMSYWLDLGVGGFRLDAVKEYYTGRPDQSADVISWIVDYCKGVKEDAYIVGEAWDSQNAIEHYYESGIDSLFNFPFAQSDGVIAKSIRSAGDGKAGKALAEDIADYHAMIRNINEQASDAAFLSNHDVGRASGFLGPDLEKVKFGNAINLLMGGNAFLYYGEELGMVGSVKGAPGKDENKRAPMYWNDSGSDGMTVGPPDMDEVLHRFESYEQQKTDNESIYCYIRNIIRIRNAYPQIGRGIETAAQEIEDGDIVALWKEYDGESILLLMNNSDEEKTISIPERDGRKLELGAGIGISGEELTVEDGTLTLTPFGVAVLK